MSEDQQPEAYKRKIVDGVEMIEIQALDDLTEAINSFALDHAAFLKEKSVAYKQGLSAIKAAKLYRRYYETMSRWMAFKTQFYGEDMKAKLMSEHGEAPVTMQKSDELQSI